MKPDKDQLKRHIHKSDLTAMEKRYLEKLVDDEHQKTGMWVEYNRPADADGLSGLYQPYHCCTVCGYSDYGTVEYGDRYCGNCGARMANGGGWQKKRSDEDGNCNP